MMISPFLVLFKPKMRKFLKYKDFFITCITPCLLIPLRQWFKIYHFILYTRLLFHMTGF